MCLDAPHAIDDLQNITPQLRDENIEPAGRGEVGHALATLVTGSMIAEQASRSCRRVMPFTVRVLPAGFDVTATRMTAALEAAGIQPVGRELRTVLRVQDMLRRLSTCLRPNRRRG